MKKVNSARQSIRSLLVLLALATTFTLALVPALNSAEARGRRVKAEPTNEGEIEDCIQNEHGMKVLGRQALNKARLPLADRVDSLDWKSICQCFGPKHLALKATYTPEVKKQADWGTKYEDQRDTIIAQCATSNGGAGKMPEAPVISSGNSNFDAKFAQFISDCSKNPGQLKNAEIHLQSKSSPRAAKVSSMNPLKYCTCLAKSMRSRVGDTLALNDLTTGPMPSAADLLRVTTAKSQSYEACVAEQVPF